MTIKRLHPRAIALIAALALAATACSSGGGNRASTQTQRAAPITATTTDPQTAFRAEVLAAYNEYNRFYDAVVAAPDPRNPALAAHLTGAALAAMQRDQAGFQSTNEGKRFTDFSSRPVVVSFDASGRRAVVDDCVGAIAHYFDTRTGQAMGAPPASEPSTEGFEFVFEKTDGVWKVSEKHSKQSACA